MIWNSDGDSTHRRLPARNPSEIADVLGYLATDSPVRDTK